MLYRTRQKDGLEPRFQRHLAIRLLVGGSELGANVNVDEQLLDGRCGLTLARNLFRDIP